MVLLLALAFGVAFFGLAGRNIPLREAAVGAWAIVSVAVVALAEALSLGSAISRGNLALGWCLVCIALIIAWWRVIPTGFRLTLGVCRMPLDRGTRFRAVIIGVFAVGTLTAALLYPVVNWDSLTYHMPRVYFWLRNGSVGAFPTAWPPQLFSSVFVEYFVMNVKALTGGSDRLVNLVQWTSYLLAIVGSSLVASELGADARGQQLAAIGVAAVPMALLQASSTQSDLTSAAWCVVSAWLILRYINERPANAGAVTVWALWLGSAIGLAFQSKSTAYGYLAPLAFWLCVVASRRDGTKKTLMPAITVVLCVLMLGAGTYVRNYRLLDGDMLALRAPNNTRLTIPVLAPIPLTTNALKNASALIATPWRTLNAGLEGSARRLVRVFGGDVDGPGLTSWGAFSLHAENATFSHDGVPSPMAVLLIMVGSLGVTFCARKQRVFLLTLKYLTCVFAGGLICLVLLAWQPPIVRVFLGLLLLASPVVGVADTAFRAGGFRRAKWLLNGLIAFAVIWGLIVLLFSDANPLLPRSLALGRTHQDDVGYWNTPYDQIAMTRWGEVQPINDLVAAARRSGVTSIGIYDRWTDIPVYVIMTALPEVDFFYVRTWTLPDKIPQTEGTPDAILEYVDASKFRELVSDGTPRGQLLARPWKLTSDAGVFFYKPE